MKKLFGLAVVAFLSWTTCVNAQPAPTATACPYIAFGAVLTAAQWNYCFQIKNDNLGYTPLNIASGTMTGPLITAASVSGGAGFNLPPGVAPGIPNNGDVWETSVGLFAQINGSTGIISNYQFERLISNYTLSNVNTAQKSLNGTTNGAVTLPAATGYRFKLKYLITNTGTTTHQWQVLFGGTATLTSGTMSCVAVSSTSSAMAATSQGYTTTLSTAYTVTAASTSATENVTIDCDGTVNINAAGTLIPQVQLTAATGIAATMLSGSFFEAWAQGSNVVVSVGGWN